MQVSRLTSESSTLALSVREFCQAYGISRSHFYALLRGGRGPRVMRVGGRTLVSREAAHDWRELLERNLGEDQR